MKKIIFSLLFILSVSYLWSQVGINNAYPEATLDVIGSVKIDGHLYLESPTSANDIRNSKLLIINQGGDIIKYDIDISKYGPINYTQFIFNDLSTNGLQDYDTKISTEDYIVTVQGFQYTKAGDPSNASVMLYSNLSTDNIEGFQIYAYKNTSTNTWFLKAFVNNSEFQISNSGTYQSTSIDMYLNLIIYRTGFISKEHTDISIDMNSSETGIAPLPYGF